jgi:hypothetical protein
MKGYPSDAEWTRAQVAALPEVWQNWLLDNWEATNKHDHHAANVALRETAKALKQVRIPLNASDSDIFQVAEKIANLCRLRRQRASARELVGAVSLADVRVHMDDFCKRSGIEPLSKSKFADASAIARMTDTLWWRKKLRKVHCQALERAAIHLGLVNKSQQIYCSDEAVKRRLQQNRRNIETLNNTIATNENGDEFTLAELVAKSTSNKQIKRAELMTRISGFERISIENGHAGIFLTITCPSRFHKWRTVSGGKVIQNPRFDSSSDPLIANQYLGKVWVLIRSALSKLGIKPYGFRVAEPQHDGTPHWHLLVFMPAGQMKPFEEVVRHYALAESPEEPGANKHRVDFKHMDSTKGTAAGYIAKYIAKNIDGNRIEKDLYGNDAATAAARVDTWASVWGIRQFQQVGGAPVTPWREARRVPKIPKGAPAYLQALHDSVNKVNLLDGKSEKSASWAHYTKAQGGVNCGRKYRVKVFKEDFGGLNRYGEPAGVKPTGICTWGPKSRNSDRNSGRACVGKSRANAFWFAPSVRHTWTIKQKPQNHKEFACSGEAQLRPWTRVNNCTENSMIGETDNQGKKSPIL